MIKIIVKRNEQRPKITIDCSDLSSSYSIKEAIKLALATDGFTNEFISKVFNEIEELDKKDGANN